MATDTLLIQEASLRELHAELQGWQGQLTSVRILTFSAAPVWTAADPLAEMWEASATLSELEATVKDLADALAAAAEGYGQAERAAECATQAIAAGVGYVFGRLMPFLLLAASPTLAVGAIAWLLGSVQHSASPPAAAQPGSGASPKATPAVEVTPAARLLTSPYVVALLRVAVSSLDDAAAGLLGVPFPIAVLLGDEGLGVMGTAGSAAAVLALARPAGYLRETAITVDQIGTTRPVASAMLPKTAATVASPPTGLTDLAARIPSLSTEGGQIRIERYGDADRASWVVYIGGTAEWNPVTADEPWDLTSNVTAVAEQGAGSYRAVLTAMREAGIQPGDPVIGVGHSQGGLIAAQMAASGEFTSVAVATFGAPTGAVPVLEGVSTITVEHTDDLIPALGGRADPDADRLFVRREAYATEPLPPGVALPAHSLTTYIETARLIDASPEPRLREFRALLGSVIGTELGTATMWQGRRVANPER